MTNIYSFHGIHSLRQSFWVIDYQIQNTVVSQTKKYTTRFFDNVPLLLFLSFSVAFRFWSVTGLRKHYDVIDTENTLQEQKYV